ncbi:hypothetical protein EIK77_009423 [Talaromyces pinophilus]|nr:hypothetical protein EIK77_009423 [Talaromyces pinophilus]
MVETSAFGAKDSLLLSLSMFAGFAFNKLMNVMPPRASSASVVSASSVSTCDAIRWVKISIISTVAGSSLAVVGTLRPPCASCDEHSFHGSPGWTRTNLNRVARGFMLGTQAQIMVMFTSTADNMNDIAANPM